MPGPLQGVRVIEMANFISGPYAAMLLADLGADVIKVEIPGNGDPFRQWGERRGKNRPQFDAYNRGKRSIALNIKDERGKEAMLRLLDTADVFIENNRPGALDRAGLGWDAIRQRNPALLYCSVTGFGSDGPYRDRPTYDAIAQAISGFQSQFTDMANPAPLGPASSDQLTGMYAAMGIAAALLDRERTGAGQRLEVTMMGASMAFLTEPIANYLSEGEISTPGLRPKRSQSYAVVCSDGLPMAIHLSSPHKFWVALTDAMGRADLRTDPRFEEQPSRVRNYDALKEEIQAALSSRPRAEWLDILGKADVPCAPINSIPEAIDDVQAQYLRTTRTYGEGDRAVQLVASPVIYGRTAYDTPLPPPEIGEHTDALLADLGFSPDEVTAMHEGGAC